MSGTLPRDRPVVLLPPSKGKADGGTEPAYTEVVDRGALGGSRRRVLDHVGAAAVAVEDAALARLAGVAARDVHATRAQLAGLDTAPTLPARVRYTGVVHNNAGLAHLDAATAGAEVLVLSALLGVVESEEPVPAYRLELAASLPPLGGLATFWRDAMADHLAARLAGRQVLDLLPGAHARAVAPGVRAAAEVVQVRFETPAGRAANAARTKVAKGRLVAQLLAAPGAESTDLTPQRLARHLEPGQGWQLEARDAATLVAVYRG